MNKIALVDDHKIFRTGLKNLIDREPFFKVAAEAKDGEELLDRLKAVKCDLVVLDLSMPNMDGMTAIKELRQRFPKLKILVLTMLKDNEHFRHAMVLGASGYILKDDAYEQLILGMKIILKGKKFVSPAMSAVLTDRYIRSIEEVEDPSSEILTQREKQILKLVAGGLANKTIASRLKISARTVETHRANLSNKLGIKNTAGLVKFAISKGLT